MSNTRQPLPCVAYNGEAPVIFISYAHVDIGLVYPEIKALHELGYRIWYDEGIEPTDEWLKKIARAIDGSAIFVVFITRSAIQSRYVNKEVIYAIRKCKLLLPVYLEEVSLPNYWELGLGDIQAIVKWRLPEDDYKRKMLKVLPGDCREKHGNFLTSPPEIFVPEGFVLIKGGTYQMGSLDNGRFGDETPHRVKLGDFYMAKYPVTVAQFENFIHETNYQTGADTEGGSYLSLNHDVFLEKGVNWRCDIRGALQNDKRHPVTHVNWYDAVAYCEWQSKKLNKTCRLPTEAEWEYACRAGTTTWYYTSDNLSTDQANYDSNDPYEDYPGGEYIANTTPVGSYPFNWWGLYDMHGNVNEWCLDWYGKKYYDECLQQGIVENPQGPATGSDRVIRGGCWGSTVDSCYSACRESRKPKDIYNYIGIRPVIVA